MDRTRRPVTVAAMELKHLKALAAVGEELHFTRAAQKLHCSNATLTARISELEGELGVELLKRNTRRVTLTKAGAELRRHAVLIMSQVTSAIHVTRKVAATNCVRIGGLDAALIDVLPQGHLSIDNRTFTIETETMTCEAALSMVEENRLDVAIVYKPPDTLEFDRACVRCEPLLLAVPQAWAHAQKACLSPQDLIGETVLIPDPKMDGFLNQLAQTYLVARGVSAERIEVKPNWQTSIAYVAAGRALAFVPFWMKRFLPPSVAAKPLWDAPQDYELNLVWRADSPGGIAGIVARQIIAASSH